LWAWVETGSLRRRSLGDGAWQNVAPSPDVDEAATEKRVDMAGEGATRDSRGGYDTGINIEVPKITEVVRE